MPLKTEPSNDTCCALCALLEKCSDATEQMIRTGGRCYLFTKLEDVPYKARIRIIRDFGPSALRYVIPKPKGSANRPKSRRRRKHV